MTSARRYLTGMRSKFNHFATWLPDEKLQLGDVGEIKDGRFHLATTLERLKIRFSARPGATTNWEHSSGSDVTVDLTLPDRPALSVAPRFGATVRFGSQGAFLFQSTGCETSVIENMAEVGDEILFAFRRTRFRPEWVVVDRLVTTQATTIMISDSSQAQIDLVADAPFDRSQSLADRSLGIRVAGWKGAVTHFVACTALTPMFGVSRLRGSIVSGTRLEAYRSETTLVDQGALEPLNESEWLGSLAAP